MPTNGGRFDGKITPSFFDRLSADEPDSMTLSEFKNVLARDLSGLLNERCAPLEESSEYVAKSILAYGVPDFSSAAISKENAKSIVTVAVEKAMENFEPRLTHVRVVPQEADEMERSIKLTVTATMVVEPYEDLLFHAIFDTSTHEVRVNANTE